MLHDQKHTYESEKRFKNTEQNKNNSEGEKKKQEKWWLLWHVQVIFYPTLI